MVNFNKENKMAGDREDIILRFKNVTKTFPGVVANKDINLAVKKGEIHTLLGENGAGKTTLMNILYGLYRQDEGQVIFRGEELEVDTPRDAIDKGIGMIHQHFMLVPPFTVLENIILGQPSARPPLLEKEKLGREVREVADKFNIKIDLEAPVETLDVGVQQKVEILKALYKGADLLILDEPTAVLTPQESQELFKMLMELKEQGSTIIFISHKLKEVMQISDRITVLRDGEVISTRNKNETDANELSKLMVGREVSFRVNKGQSKPGAEVLTLENVSVKEKNGTYSLKDISFTVKAGEIYGIAGVDGNGQKELAETIYGMREKSSGKIRISGKEINEFDRKPEEEKTTGISFIPGDRKGCGLVLSFDVSENLIMKRYNKEPVTKGITLDKEYIDDYARRVINEYEIKTPHPHVTTNKLSGGNQQKIVVGRELDSNPRLLIVMQPTRGLDVGACEFIYDKLLEQRDRGIAILLISTELEEVRNLADRMAVIYEGSIVGEVDPRKASVEEIGLMMAGSRSA